MVLYTAVFHTSIYRELKYREEVNNNHGLPSQ